MSRALHLLSCYLPDNAFVDRFVQSMASEFAKLGHELLLLPSYEPAAATLPYVQVPYALAGFRALHARQDIGPLRPLLPDALADAECAYQSIALDAASAATADFDADAAAAAGFHARLLDELEPDTVSIWNPSVPQGRLLQLACIARGLPCFGIERGLLPQTMMVESRDIGAGSDLALSHVLRSVLAVQPSRPEQLAAMRARLTPLLSPRHASAAPQPPAQMRRMLAIPDGARVAVLFLSMAAANWLPRTLPGARFASPWFADADAAVQALLAELPDDVHLVVQDHPIDRGRWRPPAHPRLRHVAGLHSGSLFDLAQLVLTLGATTLQHDALLAGKPQLLLSRSQLSGLGLAYEYEGHGLGALLARALHDEDREAQSAAAARYLPFLADHVLFGLDKGPARRTAADLARHLAAQASPHTMTAAERIERWLSRAAADMAGGDGDDGRAAHTFAREPA